MGIIVGKLLSIVHDCLMTLEQPETEKPPAASQQPVWDQHPRSAVV
jgi:hypothetical protein